MRRYKIFLSHIDRFDPEGLNRDPKNGRCEVCGGGPILSLMLAAKALEANKGICSSILTLEM
jgi:predicted class III extradiol MEMO1 family dioxygenase